jgi:4-amino-4-deoxy-L-arabinose transferase-like glycosyltransferase
MQRFSHYLLFAALWAVTCLPNLGAPSLWDIDEGNNATCSYEMRESDNWIVPTFNYRLREDKPALIYWLQMACYELLGVNETAARLPSALAALLAVLVVYELGRRMFGVETGLLAGLILGGSIGLIGAAHFANPDALLVAFCALTLALVWNDQQGERKGTLAWVGVACGLAVLAKGPIGLLAPLGICAAYHAWQRQLSRFLDWRLGDLALAFVLVAAPWYVWVTVDTRGAWILGFWGKHNLGRATAAMENHSGPYYYYLLVLCVGLLPWSIFLGPTVLHAWKRLRLPDAADRPAVRFLVVWAGAFLVFFSIVRTKLPNYILPAYPAFALLTAHMLRRWRAGEWEMPRWMAWTGLASMALAGIALSVGMLAAAGVIEVGALRSRHYPDLAAWAWLGAIFVGAAGVAWWLLLRDRRGGVLVSVATAGVLFAALVAGGGILALEPRKATKALADAIPEGHEGREVRVASYRFFQPSLVFYCRRAVQRIEAGEMAGAFLRGPYESYLFVPEDVWDDELRATAPEGARVIEARYDLYSHRRIVLVGTPAATGEAVAGR